MEGPASRFLLTRRAMVTAAGTLATLPVAAHAEWLRDEIVVYADIALRPTLSVLADTFRRQSGVQVFTFCAPSRQMLALLAHATQDDILITRTGPMTNAAAARLVAGTPRNIWRNRLVLAAAGAGSAPQDFNAAALLAALGDGKLASPDPSDASAVDGPALFQRLGVAGQLGPRLLGAADTEDAVATLKRGEAGVALCHASEVAPDAALRVLMRVPDEAYEPIMYAAALNKTAWSRNQDRYLTFLAGGAAALMPRLGLEVIA